jgi:hypothetical protein
MEYTKDFGDGRKVHYSYNQHKSSNSSMYYDGWFEGDVTSEEIYEAIGDGSWGHRGPYIQGNRFYYIKQTD